MMNFSASIPIKPKQVYGYNTYQKLITLTEEMEARANSPDTQSARADADRIMIAALRVLARNDDDNKVAAEGLIEAYERIIRA